MSKRNRICIVMGSHWAMRMGGAQFQAKCIVEALQRDGNWDVHYLASLVDQDCRPRDYRIHRISALPYMSRFGGFIWDAPGLYRAIRRIRPDIVYQRGLKAHTGILGRVCRSLSIPLVFHIAHDDDVTYIASRTLLRHSVTKWINKRIGEKGLYSATAIIAQTQYQADMLKREFGIDARLVSPNFHPLPDEPARKPSPPIRIVWIANLKPSKQPEVFVNLAAALADKADLRFIMIGRPGDRAAYTQLHARIESLPNIEFLGELPIEQVNRILSDAHLFVNTSKGEGFPNTFIQAWMRQVPVISLNVDPDSVLNEQKIGTCCHTFEILCSETSRLAEDSAHREEMGRRAAQWSERTYGPAAGRRITDLLGELVSRDGRT